jgi:hypothetical protein
MLYCATILYQYVPENSKLKRQLQFLQMLCKVSVFKKYVLKLKKCIWKCIF